MKKLVVKKLTVSIDNKIVLNSLSLSIGNGEILAIMGPNGNGKSTLLKTIMGHPRYEIKSGDILIDDVSIKDMPVNERAKLGLFFASQNPQEVAGVLNVDFLRSAINSHNSKPVEVFELFKKIESEVKNLKLPLDFSKRFVNEGFSGGEKKKNEIMQLKLLNPDFSMLDEIDSGLDVDSLEMISTELKKFYDTKPTEKTLILVSHYERLFKLIKPTRCVVIIDGQIVKDGGIEIIEKIDKEGYSWLKSTNTVTREKLNKVDLLGNYAKSKK